jgi:integrase
MLTRCRAGEIGGLCWNEIRDDVIVLPADRVKNKHAHLVPLALPALAVLAGWKRRKAMSSLHGVPSAAAPLTTQVSAME